MPAHLTSHQGWLQNHYVIDLKKTPRGNIECRINCARTQATDDKKDKKDKKGNAQESKEEKKSIKLEAADNKSKDVAVKEAAN